MIHHITFGILATYSGAGITALLIEARQIGGTVRAANTLGSAIGWGSYVVLQAAALCTVAHVATLRVGSTRRGLAGIDDILFHWRWWWLWVACDEGITRVGAYAATLWTMIQHLTLGIQATRAGTRITAMLLQAGQVKWTLRIACALGTTGGWHAYKLGQAKAHGLSIDLTALCIGSTWRGLAGIGHNSWWWGWHWHTLSKGIARHSGGAVAHGHMLMHLTDGIGATSTWTRIHTLLTHTSQVWGTLCAQDALGTTT